MKIVFFDIDGTLLDHEKKLPASTKKAVKQLQDSGVFVAIATGRAPFMFEDLREELGIDTFVSFNGQYVVFEGEVIYKNPLNLSEIRRLHKAAEENEVPIVFMNEETMQSSVPYHNRIEEALSTLKFPHPGHQADFYENNDIYQALLFCSEDEESEYVGMYDKFNFIRWHTYSTDVLPFGGSKAEGIKTLMKKVGFDLEDVYAFGDGLNDIEMLKAVGYGVAMGNAGQLVKQEADYVTTDVDKDGILHGLKELELI